MTSCTTVLWSVLALLSIPAFASAETHPAPTSDGPTASPGEPSSEVAADVEVLGARRPDPTSGGSSVTLVNRRDLESLPGGDAQPLQYALAAQPGLVEQIHSDSGCTFAEAMGPFNTCSTAFR